MIAKVDVRKQLGLYETKIKEEIQRVEDEVKKMDNDCLTEDMKVIWKASAKYSALRSRRKALTEALWLFQDFRCGEMLND